MLARARGLLNTTHQRCVVRPQQNAVSIDDKSRQSDADHFIALETSGQLAIKL